MCLRSKLRASSNLRTHTSLFYVLVDTTLSLHLMKRSQMLESSARAENIDRCVHPVQRLTSACSGRAISESFIIKGHSAPLMPGVRLPLCCERE